MAHPISNIPEILQMIFRALDRKQLARILTVSRRFFLCAIPILWENTSGLGRLRRLVFPSIRPRPQNVTQGWIDSIQELDERSLRRFNLYAPLIKSFRYHASDWSRNDWPREQRDLSWRAILKAVPMRPLLPSLARLDLSDDVQTTPTTQILEALICPKLTRIRAPGLEFANGVFNPVLSTGLLSKIAHSCPKIQELIVFPSNKPLTAPRTGVSATPESPPSPNCLASLAQLGNLRTLHTGPEALSSCLLDMLGALPSLESFVVFAPPDTPGEVFPVQLSAPANGFLALQHLGFFHGSPFRITQSWRILPCVQMLTAVTIKTDSALVTNDNDLYDLVCAICQFSPKVAELHLDLSPDSDSLFDIQLLTPTVIGHLKRLPLRRLRIRTRGIQLLPPEDYKQLALALPNVEYLDLQECYFTYQGIECLAKFNRKLQFLCVNLYRGGWPSKDELPMPPVSSPSVLCLRSNYTTDTTFWDVSKDTKKGFIDSLSTALHRLWPNGVHCVFSEHAAESCDIEAREEEDLESINSAIRQLCAPDTFDSPDIRSAEQWKYANYGLGLSFL